MEIDPGIFSREQDTVYLLKVFAGFVSEEIIPMATVETVESDAVKPPSLTTVPQIPELCT